MIRDKTVGIRLSEEEIEMLDRIAKEESRSRANLMQLIISEWLEEKKKKEEE